MAWIDLSGAFGFGTTLTSVQMQNLRDNMTALAAGDSGAPNIETAAITDGAVNGTKLTAYTAVASYQVAEVDAETNTTEEQYFPLRAIQLSRAGTVNVFHQNQDAGLGNAKTRIYVNSAAVGDEHENTTGSYVAYVDNISVSAGDILQLYGAAEPDATCLAKEFRIRSGTTFDETVIL